MMKNRFFILKYTLFVGLQLVACSFFSQSALDSLCNQEKTAEVLASINCHLSNAWTIDIAVNETTEDEESQAIKAKLFTYKTKVEGRNSGVIMHFYHLEHKNLIIQKKASKYKGNEVIFLYTNRYIVYVNYGVNVNPVYDKLVPTLLTEIKAFLEVNSSFF